jgi:hypothetical protein
LVVEVDRVDAEPLERGVTGVADVVGIAADSGLPVWAAHPPELRRQHDLIAPAFDRAPDEPLVRERPVDVSSIEERDP